MSTTLDEAPPENPAGSGTPVAEAAQEMRASMGAVELSFTWLGTQRKLADTQTKQAADTFHADAKSVRASKVLIDAKHPAYRAATAIRSQARGFLRGISLPYPQEGVRLIKYDDISRFEAQMLEFRERLDNAVATLQEHYDAIKADARERLGDLYNAADYPTSLEGVFSLTWDYPSIEPPEYLLHYNPGLYRQQQARVQERFEQAVVLAENAFGERLQELISHLLDRLRGVETGETKQFSNSTVENFAKFAAEFRRMNIRGNTQLESLINQAQSIVSGVDSKAIRANGDLRQTLSTQMGEVRDALDTILANQPRRRIMRMD
jgi:hypothetical protein